MDAEKPFAAPKSYVVKLWIEPQDDPEHGRPARLARGMVTQVETGRRWYVKSLGELVDFFAKRLTEAGVRLNMAWRIWRRMRRLRPSPSPIPPEGGLNPNSELSEPMEDHV